MPLFLLGSDHVQADVLQQIPPQERKRQEAIFELVHSEKSYVNSLVLVKEVSINIIYSNS